MTEEEWFATTNVRDMVWSITNHAKFDRKLRLFAVACCRSVARQSLNQQFRELIAEVEELADGRTNEDRSRMKQVRNGVLHSSSWGSVPEYGAAHFLVAGQGWHSALRTAGAARRLAGRSQADQESERLAQVALLRDIIGNPFRPVTFSRKWRTDTTVALARQMYESRDFGAMPILADALQEAGCDSEGILAHCRDTSLPHVRGCWVVDSVLGKA
jgi:hypothetical protein